MPARRFSRAPVALASAAIALTAVLVACGGRTTDLGDGGTSSGGSGGGSGGNGSGSGGGSGGFPYSGPSCSTAAIGPNCWSCLSSSCPSIVDCVDNACSSYFKCYCTCAQGDTACQSGCQGDIGGSCTSCIATAGQCSATACQSQCSTTGMGGGGGSSSGGGSVSPSMVCTGTAVTCPDGGLGAQGSTCENLSNGACTSAYTQVGSQTFPCTSCTDQASCQQQAQMAACP